MPDAETLAQLAAAGMSIRKIAAQYGFTPRQIQHALRRAGVRTIARPGRPAQPRIESKPFVSRAPSSAPGSASNPFGL